jgi:chitodextrinase
MQSLTRALMAAGTPVAYCLIAARSITRDDFMSRIEDSTGVDPAPRSAARALTPTLLIACSLSLMLGADTASAVRDRVPPTEPTSFRVTAITPFSVSLAWNSSTDNSGDVSYVLVSTAGGTVTLPRNATAYTWTGLHPRESYTFIIGARDAAGNGSASVSVAAALPRDRTPPRSAPVVSVTNVGSTYVSLAWTPADDDGPHLSYRILLDGEPYTRVGNSTVATVHLLDPETSYTLVVQAYDKGGNLSPSSAPLEVTTLAPNASDTNAPAMPANLSALGMSFADGEPWLFRRRPTGDFDPQRDGSTPRARSRRPDRDPAAV